MFISFDWKHHWKTIAGIVLLLLISGLMLSPKFWPDFILYPYLWKLTPKGTDINKVSEILTNKRWEVMGYRREGGFLKQGKPDKYETNKYDSIVGAMSLRGELGDVSFYFIKINVTVFWGFDKNGKLTDIWIWRTTDGLLP